MKKRPGLFAFWPFRPGRLFAVSLMKKSGLFFAA